MYTQTQFATFGQEESTQAARDILVDGIIPVRDFLGQMVIQAKYLDRNERYVLDQLLNLDFDHEDMIKLRFLCGQCPTRAVKMLMIYEFGIVTSQEILDEMLDGNEAAFYAWEAIVDNHICEYELLS